LSRFFRKHVRSCEEHQITLIIVSQIRDNIGVTFGRKTKRSGGRALDFYASQIVFLANVGMVYQTIDKIRRPIGIDVKVKVDKNKVGMPYRECAFPILFGYGIDDYRACMDFLKDLGSAKDLKAFKAGDKESLAALQQLISDTWYALEAKFIRTDRKYD